MTREELVKIIDLGMRQYGSDDLFGRVADNILAALAREREGEVVSVVGEVKRSGVITDPVNFPYFVGADLYGIGISKRNMCMAQRQYPIFGGPDSGLCIWRR